ncbi:MAG: alkaline phosphatase family protein [Arenicellales bacterium]
MTASAPSGRIGAPHRVVDPRRGFALLVSHTGGRRSWYLHSSSLRPYVSRVVLVDAGSGSYLLPVLDRAFPHVTVEHLRLTPGGSTADWTRQLRSGVDTFRDWLLALNTGCSVSMDRRFRLPRNSVPHSVIHRSRDGTTARWAPALVPGDPKCVAIDSSGRVIVNGGFAGGACHQGLYIDDPRGFNPSRKTLASNLTHALAARSQESDPDLTFEIAGCHFGLRRYIDAAFWYRRYIAEGDNEDKRWIARYRAARCGQFLGEPWPAVEAGLAEAFDTDPDRAEPLYHLARHYLEEGQWRKAWDLAAVGMEVGLPITEYPFEFSIYQHELPLLYMACAAELGKDKPCVDAANEMLRRPAVPEEACEAAARYRTRAVGRLQPYYPLSIRRKNRIVVITPFRNAGDFLRRCIRSLAAQDYQNCRFVLIDDASTDGALEKVDIRDPRFQVVTNAERRGTLRNQVDALTRCCEPDDIAVYVDGDDRLLDGGALSYVNDFFNSTRCWVMYGQYRDSNARYGRCEPITEESGDVLGAIGDMYFPMHIRAHRAGLIGRLREADPDFRLLRDDDGGFLDAVADMALMRAVMQLAGLEHIRYSDRVLYEYNTGNPESHYTEHERRRLQDRQGDVLQSRPPLRPVDTCLPGRRAGPAALNRAARTGLLFIALDGMTPRLIRSWAREGLLPCLDEFIRTGCSREVVVPKGFGNDAFWNSLVSGTLPGDHGYYYRNVFRPESYALDRYDLDREIGMEPFWGRLSETDLELAVVDIPEVKHAGRINGLEVTEWITHARFSPTQFIPPALKEDWLDRFSVDPTGGYTESMAPRTGRQFVELRDKLLTSVEQKTRGVLHYLDRGGWDLFAVGYTQGHDAGHQFWHVHDPDHPMHRPLWRQRYGDPLLQTYQAVDRSLGRLLEAAGKGAKVMIVTGLAMEAKASCNAVMDDILWEIERAEYGARAEGVTPPDRRHRRFFSVPHNNLSGAVRINLKCREPDGLIEPGDVYARTVDRLERCLRQVVNADTGECVVDEIVRTQEIYDGPRTSVLPDLLVLWNRRSTIKRISAPWFEEIVLHPRGVTDARSGDHVCTAEMTASFELPFPATDAIPIQDIAPALIRIITRDIRR